MRDKEIIKKYEKKRVLQNVEHTLQVNPPISHPLFLLLTEVVGGEAGGRQMMVKSRMTSSLVYESKIRLQKALL